jgi:uncharacterized membrane-anchored protein YhcB (DUF1043 family)
MMADEKKIEKLKKEIENLEEHYSRSTREAMFDKSQQDRVYKQLKKKRKELKQLTGE